MKHPTEHQIGMFVLDAGRAAADVRQHMSRCEECRRIADDIRAFESELANPACWDGLAPADEESPDELRALDTSFEAEYAEATRLLEEYEQREAAPRFAAYGVARLPELQTGGAVRRLCELAHGMCERYPLYALTLAEAAVAISESLPVDRYLRQARSQWRGDAWKEQANALRFLGRYPEALSALDFAEHEFARVAPEAIGIISVLYVRAWVLTEQDELDQAQRLALRAAERACEVGDHSRYVHCRHLLGTIRFHRREFVAARGVFEELLRDAQVRRDDYWLALESLAIGNCWIELDESGTAMEMLERAVTLYTRLQMPAEVSRARWAVARALFRQGRRSDGTGRLREVIAEMTRHGMLTDAAEAAVDLAEMLMALGRASEVVKLLSGVVQTFTKAGKVSGALAALAYLRDAAAAGAVANTAVRHVRRFIRRADRQPELPFVANSR